MMDMFLLHKLFCKWYKHMNKAFLKVNPEA